MYLFAAGADFPADIVIATSTPNDYIDQIADTYNLPVIVINDCSKDNTLELCRENGIPVLDLPVNLGIGGAVQTGYLYALQYGYDIAVQMDGDGQHDAAYLGRMEETLIREKADMVIGSRFIEKQGFQSSGIRRVGIRLFAVLSGGCSANRSQMPHPECACAAGARSNCLSKTIPGITRSPKLPADCCARNIR